MQTALASAARTASGVGSITTDFSNAKSAQFWLEVTAAAAAATDLLNVYIQSSIDGGTLWDDFVHFTQVLGNGGAVKHLASWVRDVTPESEMHIQQDAAMAAGVLQGPVGPMWRVKYVIFDDGGAHQTFTFSVSLRAVQYQ
jgi:hypothetical protein